MSLGINLKGRIYHLYAVEASQGNLGGLWNRKWKGHEGHSVESN